MGSSGMSLAELARAFGPPAWHPRSVFGRIGSERACSLSTTQSANGTSLAGNLRAFGLALINKVHRNLFFTFSRGIYKTDPVISADISIVDNSFSLCALAGIELGGGGRNTEFLVRLLPVLNLRHLIQSNAVAVQGKGILSAKFFTDVEQNSVQCPNVAIELDAASCTVRNNALIGIATELAPPDVGLLILHGTVYRTVRRSIVSGNRLLNASGHAILLREDLSDVALEENTISPPAVSVLALSAIQRLCVVQASRAIACRDAKVMCQPDHPSSAVPSSSARARMCG